MAERASRIPVSAARAAVPAWRRVARRVIHLTTGDGRRHARRVATDIRDRLVGSLLRWPPMRPLGRAMHRRVNALARRRPDSLHTFFLRNRPLLEQVRSIASAWPIDRTLRVASIGCSTGAELYSVLWVIQRERRPLRVRGLGADIEPQVLQKAAAGRYRRTDAELSLLSDAEIEELFVADGDELAVRRTIADATDWRLADGVVDDLRDVVGECDLVLANNVLCHLPAASAEAALRNIIRVLAPGGYLFCCGVDIDLRSRVVSDLGLTPVADDPEPIYTAEPRALWKWPFAYWAQEPFERQRPDAAVRYASVFVTRPGPFG